MIFDFDGTLTPGDTMAGFFVHCARRQPWRAAPMLLCGLLVAPLGLLPGGQRWVNSVLLWWGTVGLGRRGTVRLVQGYARRLEATPGLLLPGGVRRLRAHGEGGERIWVVSASCRQWIRPLLPTACEGDVHIVASTFVFRWGGLVMARRCHGRQKVRELQRRTRGQAWRWTWAYGDRLSDLPILSLAERQGLVGPGRQAREASRQLGDGAQLFDWRA